MNYYFLIYIVVIIYAIYIGYKIYSLYKNISGLFFLLFTIFLSLWYFLYFIFFCGLNNPEILLYSTRLNFAVGILAVFSLMFFIKFFHVGSKKFSYHDKKFIFISSLFYLGLTTFYIFSNKIIYGLKKDEIIPNVFREIYGEYYFINVILYFLFIILFIYYSFKQLEKQYYINKIRLKNVIIGTFTCLVLLIFFQLILPLFDIRIFEKEVVFLYLFFVLYTSYVLKKNYREIGINAGNLFIGGFSIISSVLLVNFIKTLYYKLNTGLPSYWGMGQIYNPVDITLGIIIFIVIYDIFSNLFLGKTQKTQLKKAIGKLKESLSFLNNFEDLNNILKIETQKILKTNYCDIYIYKNDKPQLKKYFENEFNKKVFINDTIFLEENKTKFNKNLIIEEIPKESFLIFPIYGKKGENIGIFCLGVKAFGDFYNYDEINILRDLVFFLQYHLKYIENYKQINDLSINLDKKVDEKTMEYNNLINKQKEFISMISHEIRSPISSAVFQADSIIDELENENIDKEKIKNELDILNSILIKIGDLSTKLFSVQYYDTHNITLYKEKIQINNLIKNEIEIYSHINENIDFKLKLDKRIKFIEIDKIQFGQVIENIIGNCIKFIDKDNGVISIETKLIKNEFRLTIEDNGKGFEGIELEKLFEKYSSGSSHLTGLGMGLYLCKKIIGMHNGEISAGISKELGGAKFIIKIP